MLIFVLSQYKKRVMEKLKDIAISLDVVKYTQPDQEEMCLRSFDCRPIGRGFCAEAHDQDVIIINHRVHGDPWVAGSTRPLFGVMKKDLLERVKLSSLHYKEDDTEHEILVFDQSLELW